jgi:hypothetical protein
MTAKKPLPSADGPGSDDALDAAPQQRQPEAPSDFTVAVTPGQLAAGAAIIAGLIILVARRRRRGPKG